MRFHFFLRADSADRSAVRNRTLCISDAGVAPVLPTGVFQLQAQSWAVRYLAYSQKRNLRTRASDEGAAAPAIPGEKIFIFPVAVLVLTTIRINTNQAIQWIRSYVHQASQRRAVPALIHLPSCGGLQSGFCGCAVWP